MYGPRSITKLLPSIGSLNEMTIFLFKGDLKIYESSKNKTTCLPALTIYINLVKEFRQGLINLRDLFFAEIEADISETIALSVKVREQIKITPIPNLKSKDTVQDDIRLAKEAEERAIKDVQVVLDTQIKKVSDFILRAEKLGKYFL